MTTENTLIDLTSLMQQCGMTKDLAEDTMSAITKGNQEHDGITVDWLGEVSRNELMVMGVHPFAADVIAHFQLCLRNSSNTENTNISVDKDENETSQNKNDKENSKNDDDSSKEGTKKRIFNAAFLTGGAVAGASQTTLIATAVINAVGFMPLGVELGSIAAFLQGPATVAGSWFSLLQSAGATGIIAGPVGVVATAGTAGLGLGVGWLALKGINWIGENLFRNHELSDEFFMKGIPELPKEDAQRLKERFKMIHVLTVQNFLIVSRTTMEEMFDEVLKKYLDQIVELQRQTRQTAELQNQSNGNREQQQ